MGLQEEDGFAGVAGPGDEAADGSRGGGGVRGGVGEVVHGLREGDGGLADEDGRAGEVGPVLAGAEGLATAEAIDGGVIQLKHFADVGWVRGVAGVEGFKGGDGDGIGVGEDDALAERLALSEPRGLEVLHALVFRDLERSAGTFGGLGRSDLGG